MRSLRALAASSVGIGSIMAGGLSGSALAQDAVQWRVEDGGNGHWYALSGPNFSVWSSARRYAESLGGHLATMTSAAEQTFALTVAVNSSPDRVDDAWLGGFQDTAAPDYNEPSGGWRWVTGETWGFTAWRSDGQPTISGSFISVTTVPEDLLGWISSLPTHEPGNCQAFVEWSADCNADGIVDYGQIRAGELVDVNANNIPDCCEQGSSCEINLLLNGGFESGPVQTDCTWVVHPAGSSFVPGWSVIAVSVDRERLSTACPLEIASWQSFEGEFTIDLDGAAAGGAIAQSVVTQPGRRYRLTFQLTGNCALGTKRMRVEIGSLFQEFEHVCANTNPQPWSKKSIEFESTVASTTIVLRSLLTDGRNGPVIDDVRLVQLEDTCLADIDESGVVNAVDLAAILTVWGTSGGKYPRADINNDGEVNGPDLAAVLSAWGPCP